MYEDPSFYIVEGYKIVSYQTALAVQVSSSVKDKFSEATQEVLLEAPSFSAFSGG